MAAVLVAVVALLRVMPVPVHAAPQDYGWAYDTTNVYTNYGLFYEFDTLDSATQYTFTAQWTDDNGNVRDEIASTIIGPGVTTGTFAVPFTNWPDLYGPVRVVDQFGQVLGHHFVAPEVGDEWDNSGTNTQLEKQVIGDGVYESLNAAGYHHDPDSFAFFTQVGNYVLLHYRLATEPPTDRFLSIYDIQTHSELLTFDLDEFYAYNEGGAENIDFSRLSFVVLNTAGTVLPFIDQTQDQLSFLSSYDNPHTATVPAGVYEYARYTGSGTLQSFGESVWLVSSAPANEYTISLRYPSIEENGDQCAFLSQATSAVWDDYPDQTLSDSSVGDISTTDFEYAASRKECWDGGVVADSPATVTWSWQAFSLIESIDPADFAISVSSTYEIVAAADVDAIVTIGNGLKAFGLDSVIGNTLAMIGAMLLVMFFTKNVLVSIITFLAVGGAFILLGFASDLTKILFAGSALLVIVLFLKRRNSATGREVM